MKEKKKKENKKNKYSNRLVSGTLTIIIFTIFSAGFGYLLKFVLARWVEINAIGLFYSVLALVTFLTFLRDLGLSDSLIYFIPRYIAKKDKKNIKASIFFTSKIQLIIGSLFLVFFILFSKPLTQFYFKDPRATQLLIVLGLYFLLRGFYEVLFNIFQAYQNMFFFRAQEISFQLFSFVFFVLVIFFDLSVVFFGVAYVFASLLTTLLFFYIFIKKIFPDFFKIKTIVTKKHKKKMLDYSLPGMMGSLASKIFGQQSTFFITFFVGLEGVALYIMAQSLAKISIEFFRSMVFVFYPMMSELNAKKDFENLNFHYNEIITYAYIVAFPLSFALFLFPNEILGLLYGSNFVAASSLLKLLVFYYLFRTFNGLTKRVFLSTGNPKKARNATYITLAFNTFFNIILIPSLGLVGAGIADLVSVVVTTLYLLYLQKKLLPVRIDIKLFSRLCLSSVSFIFVIVILKSLLTLTPLIKMFIILFLAGTVYLVFVFWMEVISITKIINLINILTNKKLIKK